MTPEAAAAFKTDQVIQKVRAWVQNLNSKRIFRPVLISADVRANHFATISISVTDGMTTIKSKPFLFHVPTMNFDDFYHKLEDELCESFRAMVRQKLAPQLVDLQTTPVEVVNASTDGEEFVYKL